MAAQVGTYQPCGCSSEDRTKALLLASLTQVEPLYALEKEGAFKPGDQRGVAFATARLAAGATAVRDMSAQAWEESADTPIGYPMVNVRDIESGKARAARRHELNPPAAFRQTECGGVPSATSSPFASAWRIAESTAASSSFSRRATSSTMTQRMCGPLVARLISSIIASTVALPLRRLGIFDLVPVPVLDVPP